MTLPKYCCLLLWLLAFILGITSKSADLVINEILFNPPASDSPNAYIELRGTPYSILPSGTYFVSVTGDPGSNPGEVKDTFDLSGRTIGANGFLLLLQKTNQYSVNTNATLLVNTDSGNGFGDGSSSSIKHRGSTDLEHQPVSFFLIQTAAAPTLNTDIDSDNDGVPDGATFAAWTILDSVGIAGGSGDIGYGAINFRRSGGAIVSGIVVTTAFNPSYVGRAGNSTGSGANAWVASDNLTGNAPNWSLGNLANTSPGQYAGALLNHLGSPNFGASPLPSVFLKQLSDPIEITEGGRSDFYTLALATVPVGNVQVLISPDERLRVSVDGGATFFTSRTLTLSNTSPKLIYVRANDDNVVDISAHAASVSHSIASTADRDQYPVTTIIPPAKVNITDNDSALLNEIKVNPPGGDDGPFEFVEIKGTPGALLTNVYFLAIEGRGGRDPGTVNFVLDLSSNRLGSAGLLTIAATNSPYSFGSGTTVLADSRFNASAGVLDNDSISFLLVSSPSNIKLNNDLDSGNNGVLEGLSKNATILDAVGWSDGGSTNDIVYGDARLTIGPPVPDAAVRFPGNNSPRSAAAWFFGDLAGNSGASLGFDGAAISPNFPTGAMLSPGMANDVSISITHLAPLAAAIDDPTNPSIQFNATSTKQSSETLKVVASSSDQSIISDRNLFITLLPDGSRTLILNPIGVGYATITITVTGTEGVGQTTFPYAVSAAARPDSRFHTGASDGSTAIALDSDYMLVADDENGFIRLYRRHFSGPALKQFDLNPFLDLPDVVAGFPREVDVEASTRVGNRLFWLGSHSHGADGEAKTNRTRVFATDLSGTSGNPGLAYAGRYDFLKLDMIAWDAANGHGKGANYLGLAASDADGVPPKAPDGSGFSIEGLAMMPGDNNGAYVAFRAPIVPPGNRNYALIIPVLNFTALASSNGRPGSSLFGAPIELDLYGRGIRSIERGSKGYIIVAGPPQANTAKYPQDFRLYTWSGNPADVPEERAADLHDMKPEGIVEIPPEPWTAETEVQLLSDTGTTDYYGDGTDAKFLPEPNFKKSRTDLVKLGAIVKPAPVLAGSELSGANLKLTWRSRRNEKYRVETTANLSTPNWSFVGMEQTATGPYTSQEVLLTGSKTGFFRIAILP